MIKIVTLTIFLFAVFGHGDESSPLLSKFSGSARQKRLLFYDEEGNLVKTYTNPYLRDFIFGADKLPLYGSYQYENPFFNFIRASMGGALATFTVPVSSEVVQKIQSDPEYKNKLAILPKQEGFIEPNALCAGKRTQIPSPSFCNKFLNCWDGWAFEQQCPMGLQFSPEGFCDYSDNVDCKNRKVMIEKPEVQPRCNKDFEAFSNKMNCNEFFVCVNREPIRFKCPADLVYSQILGVCDYADRVACASAASPGILAPIAPTTASAQKDEAFNTPSISNSYKETIYTPSITTVLTENSITSSQSDISCRVAASRQDAIRQLEISVTPDVIKS